MRCILPYQLVFLDCYFAYVILMYSTFSYKVEETVSFFNIRQCYLSINKSKTTHQVSFHSFDSQSMFLYCLAELEVNHHQLQQNTCQVQLETAYYLPSPPGCEVCLGCVPLTLFMTKSDHFAKQRHLENFFVFLMWSQ